MARKRLVARPCSECGEVRGSEDYLPTGSPFFVDGHLTICTYCLVNIIENENDWYALDRICQWADWAFLPEEWTRICKGQGKKGIKQYAMMFSSQDYQGKINWDEQNRVWLQLQEDGELDKAHSEVNLEKYVEIQKRWGGKYTTDELDYLENFLENLKKSFPITGELQLDQAYKLCKISLLMDNVIREGGDVKSLITGYKEIIAIGGFASKNAKNAEDFDSVAELYGYLEKTGFINQFYDGVDKDIVDKTITNIQNWNKRLILGETSIQDQADEKAKAFAIAKAQEDALDSDMYEVDGYNVDKNLGSTESQDYVDEYIDDEGSEEFEAGDI